MPVDGSAITGLLTTVAEQFESTAQRATAAGERIARQAELAEEQQDRLLETAQRTAAQLSEVHQRIESQVDQLSRPRQAYREFQDETVLAFNDLLARAEQFDSAFAQSLQAAIKLVQDGSLTVRDFEQQFGGFVITMEDGTKRISELIQGIDPNVFRQRAQELRQLLEQEKLSIEQIIQELSQQQNQYADDLVRLLGLYKAGKTTLDQVLAAARKAKASLGPDSITGTIGDGLEELLRRQRRQGGGNL